MKEGPTAREHRAEDNMTFETKTAILWIVASGLVLVLGVRRGGRPHSEQTPSGRHGLVAASIAVVAGALVVVGLVSDTLRIHLVQILPLVLVLALVSSPPQWWAAAAASVLSFWLVTMVGIWLFLLGLSRFLSGTFSPTEVVLTGVIGVASLAGLVVANSKARHLSLITTVPIVLVATGLQSLALWFSHQPLIIGRR
jgi:magnesium-transporting ATPase (P-type)